MISEITKRLHFSFTKSLPIILQSEVAECGLACVAMIASYYGHKIDLLSLRRQFSISLKGSNLQNLSDLAKKLNLVSRALKLDLEELKLLKTPCLLHWDLDHFVVLKKVRGNTIIVHDPAIGVVKYKLSQVSDHFTGVAMELTPAVDFEKKKDRTKLYLSDLWNSIIGIKLQLIQILLLSLALQVFSIVSPLFMQFVMDDVIVSQNFSLLYVLAIGFGLLILIQVSSGYIRSYIILFLSNILNIQLIANLVQHLFKLPLGFFEKRHMGDIISRFGSMSSIQTKISTDFVEGIVDGLMVIVTLIMMLVYSTTLTVIVIIALVLYISIRIALYSIMRRLNQENLIAGAKENSIFMESIRAILPLKIFGKETQRENVWKNSYVDKLNTGIRISKLGLIYKFTHEVLSGLEHITIIVLGATSVMHRELTIGMLMAYLSYRQQFVNNTHSLINKIFDYKMISLDLERVADIALTIPEKNAVNIIATPRILQGNIKVQNLAFRYSEQDPYVFKNISFETKAGEVLVIVGSSGCGKTTLLKVLLRLLTPSEGNIFVDDTDIKRMSLRDYRSQIAAVMQEDILLSGSIAENICFFDTKPDFNYIYTCAMLATIHDEITQMPMAYQSLIGDMGTALSGGQKQRILLARALYVKPKILFLDEATSHLDANNENLINQNIKQMGITRVIVAHRKETIKIADRKVNLEDFLSKSTTEHIKGKKQPNFL